MTDDDPDAIWRSDDLPVPPPASAGTHSSPTRRAAPEDIVFDTLIDEREPAPRRVGSAAVIVAVAIAAVVGIAAIVGVVASGSDDSGAPRAAEPATTPADSVVDEPVDRTDAPTTTTTASTTSAAATSPEQIELPAAVAAIGAPTEVLALTPNGLLHTLSLPSGRVRTTDLSGLPDNSFADGFSALIVAPDSAAVGSGGSKMVVMPRSGEPIEVDLGVRAEGGGTNVEGWVRAEDGSTRYVVMSYPAQGRGVELLVVGEDGAAEELPQGFVPYGFGPASAVQGELIVNDAGGAYRVAADGTAERIEDGFVYANDVGHRLVRECDERQQCSTVLVTAADGARRVIDPAVLPEDFRELIFGIVLSPDGSAASMLRSTTRQQRVIVDFDIGEVASVDSDTWLVGSTWAADSSGLFDVAQGALQFIDRATGESVEFGDELGSIVAIGVRRPDAELPDEPTVVSTALTSQQPIATTQLVLSAAGRTGGIGVLSVDSLELTTWQSPLLGRGSAALADSGAAVLALPADGVPAFLTTPGGDTTLGDNFATSRPMLFGPTDDTIWVPDDTAPRADVRYRLLRLDGTVADDLGSAVVDLTDASLLGSDGRGGLVVERRGDVFVVGVDPAVRLTSGELVAIGATTAYVRECESVDDCAVIRIDRTADAREPVSAGPVVLDELGAMDAYRGAALGTTVSPDGDVLVSRLAALNGGLEPTLQTALLDIRTGDVTFVDGEVDDQPIVWNDDSTFAALLTESGLHVYDRAADRTVDLDGARLRAIGPAPRTPSPDQ